MNRQEYFEIGKQNSLPLRCPILNYCARRACTIYFNSDYARYSGSKNIAEALMEDGTLPNDYLKNKIDFQGEPTEWIGGRESFYVTHMCPEVNLFDSSNSIFPDTACVTGDYDRERRNEKSRVIKTQHYSECAEFNKYLFEKNIKPQTKKRRIPIAPKFKALLQKEINSKCPLCPNEDVGHFEIHHIDENPENNNLENLLMLCPTCHSKITKGDISIYTVRKTKRDLTG
ncbi:HNH endonuclease [Flavobacterium microcysteis]|nr:HNH endonuclease [Flavobacterium microcysteis]